MRMGGNTGIYIIPSRKQSYGLFLSKQVQMLTQENSQERPNMLTQINTCFERKRDDAHTRDSFIKLVNGRSRASAKAL